MTIYLTIEDVVLLAEDLGVGPMRDLGLLDSAAARPKSSVFGHEAYESLEEKAAVLLESILRNHALVDGNKRLGWLAFVVFLDINGTFLDVDDDEAYDMVIALAAGEILYPDVVAQLRLWTSG